jgi:hypothetical protein
MCSQWQYDDCLNYSLVWESYDHPSPFLSGDYNVPEELDFTDEEIDELIQINEEHAERLSNKDIDEILADSEKIKDKAITEALKDEGV